MVDDSKYVIVPNQTKRGEFNNPAGDHIAELIIDGYHIKHKMSNRDSVHYVMIKFIDTPKGDR